MGILEDIDLVAFARETAERAAAGGETVRRTEMIRCAWLMLELIDINTRCEDRIKENEKDIRKLNKELATYKPAPEQA